MDLPYDKLTDDELTKKWIYNTIDLPTMHLLNYELTTRWNSRL